MPVNLALANFLETIGAGKYNMCQAKKLNTHGEHEHELELAANWAHSVFSCPDGF